MPDHLDKIEQDLIKHARRLWHAGFMLDKKENVRKNSGLISFKRGKDTPAPNHIMKSTKEPHIVPQNRLPNCKRRRRLLKNCAKKKNCNSKALKQAKNGDYASTYHTGFSCDKT